MNCREAQSHIYLYRELTAREQDQLNIHVSACVRCSRLREAVKTQSNMITAAGRISPQIPDATRLTWSIMKAVEGSKRKNATVLDSILSVSSSKVLRYSMALVSLLLTVTFIMEFNAGTRLVGPYKIVPTQRNVKLNSASFHAMYIEARRISKNTTSFYECVVMCLNVPDGNCQACKNHIAKLN